MKLLLIALLVLFVGAHSIDNSLNAEHNGATPDGADLLIRKSRNNIDYKMLGRIFAIAANAIAKAMKPVAKNVRGGRTINGKGQGHKVDQRYAVTLGLEEGNERMN
ncbi:hypothetical protein ANCCAN_03093 [Ancylostoma caninum]|uniref:Uncharacterized protein n=1 Tax=Ancylostoma caninum TaxID=29170 RepID=A0A368H6H2_ANCCA|nr:hypothetical protein ANCCAN_03093 [Ancylostoma caninum]